MLSRETRSAPETTVAFAWPARFLRLARGHKNTLAILLFLCFVGTLVIFSRPSRFELIIEIASNTPSESQLFFDTGRGITEQDSIKVQVTSNSLSSFEPLVFLLPAKTINAFRFDPSNVPGQFAIRRITIKDGGSVLRRLNPSRISPLNQIATKAERNGSVEFSTVSGATDPSLLLPLGPHLRLKKERLWENLRATSTLLLVFLAVAFLATRPRFAASERALESARHTVSNALQTRAERLSSPEFIAFDRHAVGFYALCLTFFALMSIADLNGSSIAIYNADYHRGAPETTWVGSPRGSRSDEWGYVTPDILNQCLRSEPFALSTTALGAHSVGLTGNIPVRHFSTLFRPQFWSFFVLPVDYAFAVYWQFKILLLLTGVFTWILLATGSTFWSVAGSLWYFFSPFTQWSLSWPSALAEMVGVMCWATVLICYLTVGRSRWGLAFAALGVASCLINFGLCAYPPHLIPLAWLSVIFFAGWCVAKRRAILSRDAARTRIIAALSAFAIVGLTGWAVFADLRTAIFAIAETTYPGKRICYSGGSKLFLFMNHFMQWQETEKRCPPAIGNMCEGSGFLWLAPLVPFCFGRLRLASLQKAMLCSLLLAFCLFAAWLLLPVPASVGALLLLNKTAGARVLPALGLANVTLAALAAAHLRKSHLSRTAGLLRGSAIAAVSAALFLLAMEATNRKLDGFFTQRQIAFAAVFAALLVALFLCGRKWSLAVALVASQAIAFGGVNPVEKGLTVVTSSRLFTFVRAHQALLHGKWIVFSDSPVMSGFVASTGLDVYTGTHYLPDIDHFKLFAADGLNLGVLNRLGYLDAHLRPPDEAMKVRMPVPIIVEWRVNPNDAVLRQIGIQYFAFDGKPPAPATAQLVPLSDKPLDGFWLYRYQP